MLFTMCVLNMFQRPTETQKQRDGQTDRQTDRRTDGQAGGLAAGQAGQDRGQASGLGSRGEMHKNENNRHLLLLKGSL